MLKYRLIFGTILASAAIGILFVDPLIATWRPILLACMMLMGVVTSREIVGLFAAERRPHGWFVAALVCLVIGANWLTIFPEAADGATDRPIVAIGPSKHFASWNAVVIMFIASVMIVFIREMRTYVAPGQHIERMALTIFAVSYLGLFGCFFVRLNMPIDSTPIVLLAIFVPKLGDIGAYTFGSLFGRHKMSPILSPKKTWEGFAGAILGSVLAAVIVQVWKTPFRGGWIETVGFGVVMSIAGMVGDLAESLIKRDAGIKDAAKSIPGFGGLLDVVDSVLFAAPVAYLWFAISAWR